jgi:preprotein translocase subunit SecE
MEQGLFISPKKIKYTTKDEVIIQSIAIFTIISFFSQLFFSLFIIKLC